MRGPAEVARVEIYRDSIAAGWLIFTYYNMNTTRQAITDRTWSELQAVPTYTENNQVLHPLFQQTRPYL